MLVSLVTAACAYLVGSVPFSYLAARAFGVADVRRAGSGNVGATNVLRTAGKAAGLLAFAGDAGKGALATALASRISPEPAVAGLAAVAAVIGHMHPIWLRFRGGKGVATGFGGFAPLEPLAAGVAALTFGVVAAATRFVSLGSVAGALALPVVSLLRRGVEPIALAGCITAGLVLVAHRSNLRRILADRRRAAAEEDVE